MTFLQATDNLRVFVLMDRLAEALGRDVGDVRRMRKPKGKNLEPPQDWKPALAKLAVEQAEYFTRLAAKLS